MKILAGCKPFFLKVQYLYEIYSVNTSGRQFNASSCNLVVSMKCLKALFYLKIVQSVELMRMPKIRLKNVPERTLELCFLKFHRIGGDYEAEQGADSFFAGFISADFEFCFGLNFLSRANFVLVYFYNLSSEAEFGVLKFSRHSRHRINRIFAFTRISAVG